MLILAFVLVYYAVNCFSRKFKKYKTLEGDFI